MNRNRIAKAALIFTLALVPALGSQGCINLAKQYPEKQFFALTPERAAAKRATAPDAYLRVQPFHIHILFGEKLLMFRVGEQRFEADFYSEFIAAPRMMLTDQTRDWLRNSGLFAGVGDSGSSIEPTYLLEGYVEMLYGDTRTKPGQAVIGLQFTLIKNKPAERAIVLQKSYARQIPLEKMSPENLAAGLNQGLAQILTEFENDLAELFRNGSH